MPEPAPPTVKYCADCGGELRPLPSSDTAQFCPGCGQRWRQAVVANGLRVVINSDGAADAIIEHVLRGRVA